jgi:hypothetical protein
VDTLGLSLEYVQCEQDLSYICCLEIELLKGVFQIIFGDLKLHNFHIVAFFGM